MPKRSSVLSETSKRQREVLDVACLNLSCVPAVFETGGMMQEEKAGRLQRPTSTGSGANEHFLPISIANELYRLEDGVHYGITDGEFDRRAILVFDL